MNLYIFADIDHIFKQFVFETMSLTGVDDDGVVVPPLPANLAGVVDSSQVIPWDDPYPFYRCMLPVEEEPEVENAFPIPDGEFWLIRIEFSYIALF